MFSQAFTEGVWCNMGSARMARWRWVWMLVWNSKIGTERKRMCVQCQWERRMVLETVIKKQKKKEKEWCLYRQWPGFGDGWQILSMRSTWKTQIQSTEGRHTYNPDPRNHVANRTWNTTRLPGMMDQDSAHFGWSTRTKERNQVKRKKLLKANCSKREPSPAEWVKV